MLNEYETILNKEEFNQNRGLVKPSLYKERKNRMEVDLGTFLFFIIFSLYQLFLLSVVEGLLTKLLLLIFYVLVVTYCIVYIKLEEAEGES